MGSNNDTLDIENIEWNEENKQFLINAVNECLGENQEENDTTEESLVNNANHNNTTDDNTDGTVERYNETEFMSTEYVPESESGDQNVNSSELELLPLTPFLNTEGSSTGNNTTDDGSFRTPEVISVQSKLEIVHEGRLPLDSNSSISQDFSSQDSLATSQPQHVMPSTSGRPHVCETCNKGFAYFSQLDCHKRVHTRERPYKCNQCDMRFQHKGNLTKHQAVHTKEKRFKCEDCKEQFSQNSSLKRHERTHTGEKSFQCRYCKKTFTRKDIVRKHERTHTGEVPYQCSVCGEQFREYAHMKSHVNIHHSETQE